MQQLNLKKFFLYLLIGSVSVSAVIGIGVIILGNFGEFEGKIIGTTLVITGTSILGLACGANIESKGGKFLPYSGIVFSIISAIILILMIWVTPANEEFYFKLAGSTALLAVVFSQLSLVTLAKLDDRFRWAMILLFVSATGLVLILLGIIWSDGTESELVGRVVGVLSIGVAALTIMIPIFHRLSDNLDSQSAINAEIEKLQTRISELEKRREKISNST
jgi:hypothetical protein